MVSSREIFVNKQVTSKDIKNLPYILLSYSISDILRQVGF